LKASQHDANAPRLMTRGHRDALASPFTVTFTMHPAWCVAVPIYAQIEV